MGDIDISYNMIGAQANEGEPPWLAALLTLLNQHGKLQEMDTAEVLAEAGLDRDGPLGWDACMDVARAWGLGHSAAAGKDVEEWAEKLRNYGPLWACPEGRDRAVIITGMRGDGTNAGTEITYIDPYDSYAEQRQSSLERLFARLDWSGDGSNIYFMHH